MEPASMRNVKSAKWRSSNSSKSATEPQTQEQIRDRVEGQTRVIRAALTALVAVAEYDKDGRWEEGETIPIRIPEFWFPPYSGNQKTRIRKSGSSH